MSFSTTLAAATLFSLIMTAYTTLFATLAERLMPAMDAEEATDYFNLRGM